jgi:hypothetical protein
MLSQKLSVQICQLVSLARLGRSKGWWRFASIIGKSGSVLISRAKSASRAQITGQISNLRVISTERKPFSNGVLKLSDRVSVLERFSDVSVLLHYLVLETVNEKLRLKKISHDDVRVAHRLSSHLSESKIQTIPIPVDLVLKEPVDYVGNTGLLVYHLVHQLQALILELVVSLLRFVVLSQHLGSPLQDLIVDVVIHE